eukprot:TRINITY_DN2053_c0_g1_i1.p1 TRINITY_DN2053_c0_g1~~TRINITY_DN2053_c0_g1_i1.p1  ORF type:complete len:181 (-),score=14.47 TRINITY_DN2053_c0_g1_i1:54-596(-)
MFSKNECTTDECENYLPELLESKKIKTVINAIKLKNCNSIKGGIRCTLCKKEGRPPLVGAFYDARRKQISLCCDTDNNLNRQLIKESLLHELVHAYDECDHPFSVHNTQQKHCYLRACTEIRAALLANCRKSPNLKECVFSSAYLSCKASCSVSYIRAAWGKCFSNTSPFPASQIESDNK